VQGPQASQPAPASSGWVLGPSLEGHEPPAARGPAGASGGAGGGGGARAAPSAVQFSFDLVLTGAEPWRLHATDVQSFQLVTSALGALLAQRAVLPTFAVLLGLGCTPSG